MQRPVLKFHCGSGGSVGRQRGMKVRWRLGVQGTGIVRMDNIIVLCLKQFLKDKIEINLKSNLKDS